MYNHDKGLDFVSIANSTSELLIVGPASAPSGLFKASPFLGGCSLSKGNFLVALAPSLLTNCTRANPSLSICIIVPLLFLSGAIILEPTFKGAVGSIVSSVSSALFLGASNSSDFAKYPSLPRILAIPSKVAPPNAPKALPAVAPIAMFSKRLCFSPIRPGDSSLTYPIPAWNPPAIPPYLVSSQMLLAFLPFDIQPAIGT